MKQLKDYKHYEIFKDGSSYYGKNFAGGYTITCDSLEELKVVIDKDTRSEIDSIYDALHRLYKSKDITYNDLFNDSIYAYCAGFMPKVSISALFNAVIKLRGDIDSDTMVYRL